MRSEEIGCVRLWAKEDPNAFLLHPDLWADVRQAWMNGETFFEGRDCYDDLMVVKLSAIVVISLATPKAMAEAGEDAEADRLKRGGE